MLKLLPILALGLLPIQDHGGRVAWVRDPEIGMASAKSTERNAVLYFSAEW